MNSNAAGYFGLRNRRRTIGILVLLIVLCSGSVGLYLLATDLYSEYQIRDLIKDAYDAQRPGGGRLFGAPHTVPSDDPHSFPDLGRAQVFLLLHPDINDREMLQSMIYLASDDWHAYVERRVSANSPKAPETLNNLGVSFLALSDVDPTYLLKALDQFERAAQMDPPALEPRFNLVITYRRLRLPKLADESLQQYAELDSQSAWYRELMANAEIDESELERTARPYFG